jgi:hypothetical protein
MYNILKAISRKNKFPVLFGKIFTKPYFKKILMFFIVGFISRIFINNIYNINIFSYYLYQISVIYYFIFAWISLIIHEFLNYFYLTMDVSPPSKSIPKLKSDTLLKMEPSEKINPSNKPSFNNSRTPVSNRFNTAWQERHDEEIRLIKEKREEAIRLREEKKD